MFKKTLSLLLALAMLICLLPQLPNTADATDESESTINSATVIRKGDWSYDYFFRRIVKYHGSSATVTVPTSLGGYDMEGIDRDAFKGNTKLKKVTIPSGISYIGMHVFENCSNLETVVLPNNLSEIGSYAFAGCTKLKSINLPTDLEELYNCVFKNCTSLASITLPRELRAINEDAFYGCKALKSIHLGPNVSTIWDNPFTFCSSLQKFTVDANNDDFSANSDGVLLSKYGTKLVAYPAGKTGHYTVPETVTDVLDYAFKGSRISSVSFESDETDISDIGIFEQCYNLTSAHIPAEAWHMSYTFRDCTALTSISIPDETGLGNGVFSGCTALREVWFEGAENDPVWDTFLNVTADVYYPGDLIWPDTIDSLKWKPEKLQDYGGNLNWIPYCTGLYHYAETGTVLEEPTCVDTGTMDCICLYCGEPFIKILRADRHPYAYETIYEATCTHEGRRIGTCTICGDVVTETVPRLPHDIEGVDAVYQDGKGKHSFTCKACGTTALTENCSMTPYTVTREPALTAIGLERSECTVCHHADHNGIGYRIRGASRYDTSLAIAEELKQLLGIDQFQSVILASGTNFPDALAGSYLAIRKSAPILLVSNDNLDSIRTYLQENLIPGGTAYILGGNAAVSAEAELALNEAGILTNRLSGPDRYSTNLAILVEAGMTGDTVLVCTGRNFADSLSASACGLPILLVNPGTGALSAQQEEYLRSLAGDGVLNFTIIGGTGAVPEAFEALLNGFGGTVTRIKGSTREETSEKFARAFRESAQGVAITYSQNFPDGLCGGPLAYQLGIPLMLVNATTYGSAAGFMASRSAPQYGIIFGGSAAVSDETAGNVFSTIS